MRQRSIETTTDPIVTPIATHRSAPHPSVDWRFLLPSTVLGRVALVGHRMIELEEAVCTSADSVTRVTRAGGRERFDTVICRGENLSQVRLAVRLVQPSGSLRVHSPARAIRGQIRRLLEDQGFAVSTWWARPSTDDARCLIALDHRRAAATTMRAVGDRGRRAPLEAALARSGLAMAMAADVSILAVAPRADGQRDTRSAVAAPDVEHPVAALVTPRYAASRTVVGLATDETGRQITRIAKLARSVAHQTTLIEESRMLDAFLARSIDRHHVPTGHHLALNAGCVALVENAVDGYPLDRRAVRRNPSGALRAGLAWLEQVPTSDSVEPFDGERFDELIGRPLAAIEAALPGSSGEDPSSSRAGELLSTLRGMALPVVFEHGDLSHPNLFVDPADDLVVIDWEQARPDGLPLHDAFYFIAYLAESVDRPDDDDSLIASYREAFSCSGWARPDIDLHLERLGIDPRQVPLLNLACWTRMLAQALGSPPTARTRHRADRMWRAAIEDAERCAR